MTHIVCRLRPLFALVLIGLVGCQGVASSPQAHAEDPFSLTPTEKEILSRFSKDQGGNPRVDLERLHRKLFPGWDQGLSAKHAAYLQKTKRKDPAIESEIFHHVSQRYFRAIATYSETLTTTCKTRILDDEDWVTRLIAKFGKDNLKRDFAALRLAIGARWQANDDACMAEVLKELLAAESFYRHLLFDRLKDLLEFIATLDTGERAAIKQAEGNLRALISAHRKVSWVSVVWTPGALRFAVKAKKAPKHYVDFLSTDPSFQAPFAAFRAIKQLSASL